MGGLSWGAKGMGSWARCMETQGTREMGTVEHFASLAALSRSLLAVTGLYKAVTSILLVEQLLCFWIACFDKGSCCVGKAHMAGLQPTASKDLRP